MFGARAAARGLSHRFEIDSAGVGGWHEGDPPDPRAIAAAARRGVDLSALRARAVTAADFHRFDWILGMDASNVAALRQRAPEDLTAPIVRITTFAGPGAPLEVADPYYGGADGFEAALDLLERCVDGLLAELTADLAKPRRSR